MSVINQVLNQLEQRGAHTAPKQTMVRAVPHGQRKFAMSMSMPLLASGVALGVALAAGVVAWQWIQMRKPRVVAVSAVQHQPVLAIPAPITSPLSADSVTDMSVNSAGVSADETPPTEMFMPASRLSFEIASVPLPSVAQQDQGQAVSPFATSGGSGQVASTGSGHASLDVKNDAAVEERSAKPAAARSAKLHSTKAILSKAQAASKPSEELSPMKRVSPAQQAEAEFRNAVASMQQGHVTDAMAGYEAALRLDANHVGARQALVALLLESRRAADAEHVLQEGLKFKPEHTGFAMLLARLQVERGTVEQAMATLEKSLPYAESQADYQAFYAALLQRLNRHKEAITHYQLVLELAPDNGVWLMGYGISLQAVQRDEDARNAYRRALEMKTLSPELQAFVQQKLRGL